jgi:AcrR family transcriptional regulator
VAQRLTRGERKERTRAELVAAARQVFLRSGFHSATLEDIAAEAGYTKGAVYSNFDGKDDLFLAVLDDNYEQQRHAQVGLMRSGTTLDAGLRAAARALAERARQDPKWTPLLVEFWTHASRNAPLRREVLARHERQMDVYAATLAQLAAQHDLEFAVPPRQVARSANALTRGVALERLLDPDAIPARRFEDMFAMLVLGHTRPRERPA